MGTMRIGYPCISRTLGCVGARTFRLRSYSLSRLEEVMASNLDCLETMLHWNADHGLRFFRITSDLVPLASHPEVRPPWQERIGGRLSKIGRWVSEQGVRIDMHPGQYTVLNAKEDRIVANAILDLEYHCDVLDLMGLDHSAKIQIHVGGVYGDRAASMERFVNAVRCLPEGIGARLVIENDERSFPLEDCLTLSSRIGIPVVFDAYHHDLLNRGEPLRDALATAGETWGSEDGIPIVDYSSPAAGGRFGRHAETLDVRHFKMFLAQSAPHDFDLMLEIKDKELSALRAAALAGDDVRLVT